MDDTTPQQCESHMRAECAELLRGHGETLSALKYVADETLAQAKKTNGTVRQHEVRLALLEQNAERGDARDKTWNERLWQIAKAVALLVAGGAIAKL